MTITMLHLHNKIMFKTQMNSLLYYVKTNSFCDSYCFCVVFKVYVCDIPRPFSEELNVKICLRIVTA